MGKQIFQITGMSQDLADSKISSEKAFEIKNMRVTAQENSNMPALISEKGNIEIPLYEEDGSTSYNIPGNVVGYCTLNEFIVLFIHSVVGDINVDYILRLSYDTSTPKKMLVHELYHGNLGFNELGEGIHIDTHTCYETENNQKVYWIDGVHQPRFINIVANEETQELWLERTNPFDFNPPLKYEEEVSIEKTHLTGLFPAGTIQYVFSYFNRWGQQTAAFHTSPIYYTSPINRGGSPEESISNAFKIAVYNADTNYDYVRVYSVLRTSENGTPYCKLIGDFTFEEIVKIVWETRLKRYEDDLGDYINSQTPSGSAFLQDITSLKAFKNTEDIKPTASVNKVQTELSLNDFLVRTNTDPYYKYVFDYNTWICYTDENNNEVQITSPMIYNIRRDWFDFLYPNAKIVVEYDSDYSSWRMHFENIGGVYQAVFAPQNIMFRVSKSITTNGVSFIDNNTVGSVVDYAEIQFLGGANIIPNTLEEKQNTLFFGNYELITPPLNQDLIDAATGENGIKVFFKYKEQAIQKPAKGVYAYNTQLDYNESEITTFKGGESYYFGITFQDNVGQWSSVIPLGSYTNELYPQDNIDYFYPVEATAIIPEAVITELNKTNFKRYKLVVYDNLLNRSVCQGILAPTVFNRERQKDVYAWPSWFFRPISPWGYSEEEPNLWGKILSNRHFCNIPNYELSHDDNTPVNNGDDIILPEFTKNSELLCTNSEIEGASPWLKSCVSAGALYNEKDFYVDWNVLTLNSPDIEFEQVTNLNENLQIKIVGLIPATASQQNLYITTSTPAKCKSSTRDYVRNINNFIFRNITTSNIDEEAVYGPYMTFSWYDISPDLANEVIDDEDILDSRRYGWMPIYPWNYDYPLSYLTSDTRTGHTSDYRTDEYGKLDTKVFADMKYSAYTIYGNQLNLNLNDYKLLFNDYQSVQFKYNNDDTYWNKPKNYSNTCDLVLPASSPWNEWITFLGYDYEEEGQEVQSVVKRLMYFPNKGDTSFKNAWQYISSYIRYKSTPHAVMELSWNNGEQTVIPKLNLGNGIEYTILPGSDQRTGWPFWSKERAVDNKDYDIENYEEMYAIDKCIDETTDLTPDVLNTDTIGTYTKYTSGGQITAYNLTTIGETSTQYNETDLVAEVGNYAYAVQACNYTASSPEEAHAEWKIGPLYHDQYQQNPITVPVKYLIINKEWLSHYIQDIKYGQIIYFPYMNFNCLFYVAYINDIGTHNTEVVLYEYPKLYNDVMWRAATEGAGWKIVNGSSVHGGVFHFGAHNRNSINISPKNIITKWYNNRLKLFLQIEPEGEEISPECTYYEHTALNNPTWNTANGKAFKDLSSDCPVVDEFYLPEQEFNEDEVLYPIDNPFKGYYYLAEFYDPNVPEINEKDITYRDCGLPAMIGKNLYGTYGDTYYQRYDCLKTYPYSPEDQNQIVEILSFMCETRVNIDGRYDKMRGLADNTIVTNTNFNLLNKTYSQRDNLQSYNYLDPKYFNADTFGNQIIWTKTKQYNEKVDSWTNIIPTSVLSLQGDKGNITKLINWNNNLLCFQDKAIAKIDYNERVALSTSDGVPVELANSGKVTGYNYLSTTIGCSNKRSVYPTVSGIYFADSNNKEVYLFNDQLNNLSKTKGFNTYFYNYDFSKMHTDYDNILKSVYFVNENDCLCYDEQTGGFEAFYSYNDSEMFNFNNEFLALHNNGNITSLWRQFGGNYNYYFGTYQPFGFTLVTNDQPVTDKIFTNLEYRADTYDQEGSTVQTLDTFDTIRLTTEYQDTGNKELSYGKNLKKRFRIWRVELPREEKMRRIRNPWSKVTISKNNDTESGKTIVHDMIVTYL